MLETRCAMKRAAVSSILVAVVLLTLGVTAEARMNFPGPAKSNWIWRCTEEIKTVFNYPILTECYKVAAYNAANKLASVRHAARAADPSAPAQHSPPAAGAGFGGSYGFSLCASSGPQRSISLPKRPTTGIMRCTQP